MTEWLVLRLEAPLASFGEEAGNVARGTAGRPTKSAILGLLGAALGLDREDDAGQAALAAGYRIATRTRKPGTLLRDYHTIQSLPRAKGQVSTRAAALRHRLDLHTSITRRDYRADVAYDIAVCAEPGARWALSELAEALRRPRFVLWLGRKSCPPAAPLCPEIVEATDARAAFAALDRDPVAHAVLAAETRADLGGGNRPVRRHRRRDHPLDRRVWHFAERDEFVQPWRERDEDVGEGPS